MTTKELTNKEILDAIDAVGETGRCDIIEGVLWTWKEDGEVGKAIGLVPAGFDPEDLREDIIKRVADSLKN